MKVEAAKVVSIFREMADLLSIKGENPFRIRAYEKAAETLGRLPADLQELHKQDKLKSIPGLGKGMLEKIAAILDTGKFAAYEELKRDIPEGVRELLFIREVGPKTVKLLYQKVGVRNIDDLEEFVKSGKLRNLAGMGANTDENILTGINLY